MSDPLTPSPLSGPVDECAALRTEVERLQRRLFPAQGDGYANEVERQRNVIDGMKHAAETYKAERDEARAQLAEVRRTVSRLVHMRDRYYAEIDKRCAAETRLEAVQALVVAAIKAVPRRTGTPEWSKGAAVAQAAGFDMGLAVASDAADSALAVSPPEPEADEGCCDHSSGMDVYGCWDCQNTGHAHPADEPCAAPQPGDQPKCEHGEEQR